MVGQHSGQRVHIGQKLIGSQPEGLECRSESLFIRREHREGTLRLQRFNQTSSHHSGHQRRELPRRNRYIDNIHKNRLHNLNHSFNHGFGSRRGRCYAVAI